MKKSITGFMKLLSLTIVLAMIMPVVTNAQAGKTNFAGSWTFNATKSTQPPAGGGGQGGGMRMMGGDRVVTQEANLLTSATTRNGQDGTPTTTTLKYTLDGKESINTNPRGDSKSVATWSADGKSLTVKTSRTMDMNGQSMTMVTDEVWTLTDAKTLSVATTRNGRDGAPTTTTSIYDKK
jgi:hypothetical protein